MSGRTRTQQRAELAAKRIEAVARKESWRDEYQSILLGLGPMILQNGLLPTLAFLKAKAGPSANTANAEDPRARLLDDVRVMLVDAGVLQPKDDLLSTLSTMSSAAYARAQEETLAAVGWLKRFSLATWARKPETRA